MPRRGAAVPRRTKQGRRPPRDAIACDFRPLANGSLRARARAAAASRCDDASAWAVCCVDAFVRAHVDAFVVLVPGSQCVGPGEESRVCNTQPCTGQWNEWTQFSPCSTTCGGGQQQRQRLCLGGRHGDQLTPTLFIYCGETSGTMCVGNAVESRPCSQQPCPTGQWTEWTAFGPCSQTCGNGQAVLCVLCKVKCRYW